MGLITSHESGHAFANLMDEYTDKTNGQTGTLDNKAHVLSNQQIAVGDGNCYAGTPPNPDWAGIVADSEYTKGCWYSNWYKPLSDSIMMGHSSKMSVEAACYNKPSQRAINRKLDATVGKFPGGDVPLSACPLTGAAPTGETNPIPSATSLSACQTTGTCPAPSSSSLIPTGASVSPAAGSGTGAGGGDILQMIIAFFMQLFQLIMGAVKK